MFNNESILYGLKLHALAFRRKGTIHFHESLILATACENDLSVFKENWGEAISNRTYVGDKIYSDFEYFNQEKASTQKVEMLTTVKDIKGEPLEITQRNKAFNDIFSTAVSKIRQHIESLFNWLNEKINIQRAMKVRSTSGILVHTMGKIAIAFILYNFLTLIRIILKFVWKILTSLIFPIFGIVTAVRKSYIKLYAVILFLKN